MYNIKDLMIYQTEKGEIRVNIDSNNETVLATQEQIAIIFNKEKSVITKHINKILNLIKIFANTLLSLKAEANAKNKERMIHLILQLI